MALRPDEISALIKEQIKHYDDVMEQKDVGTVMTVGDGVSVVHGLDNAMLGELILFPGDVYGMVMNLDEDSVGVTLLGNADEIKEGDEVRRTGKIIEVPVGDAMLGRVVNPLGQPIDGQGEIITTKTRPIERVAPGVMTRKSVDQPVQTGITTIDAIIPVGRGQRELIIGDRQTGKTAIAVDTIINQKGQDMYCIYVAIGQKNSTVAQVVEKLKKAGAMDYTVVVSASASASVSSASSVASASSSVSSASSALYAENPYFSNTFIASSDLMYSRNASAAAVSSSDASLSSIRPTG